MKFRKIGEPKKRLAKYLFFVFLLLLLFRGPLEGTKKIFEKIILPVKSVVYKNTNKIGERYENIKNIKATINENKTLKVKVSKLSMYNDQINELETENERLRDLLKMKKRKKYSFKIGEVSFLDSITYHENIYIDQGRIDGLEENMVVLSNDTLIGRVKEVYKSHSLVELLTKSGTLTSALDEKRSILGVLKGNNTEILKFENVPSDKVIEVGDKIYTSGMSDIYKKDLYIGEVIKINEKEGQLFKSIEVKQNFNVFELNEVVIVGEE